MSDRMPGRMPIRMSYFWGDHSKKVVFPFFFPMLLIRRFRIRVAACKSKASITWNDGDVWVRKWPAIPDLCQHAAKLRAMLRAPPWGTARHFLTHLCCPVGALQARNHPYQRRQPVALVCNFCSKISGFLLSCLLARWWRRKAPPNCRLPQILGNIAQWECLHKSARWSVKKILEPWARDLGGKLLGKLQALVQL